MGEFKSSEDLTIGDRVNVWWMPEGASLIAIEPYRGPFDFVHGIGIFEAGNRTRSGSIAMSLIKGWRHEIVRQCAICQRVH